jgi:hypothetical protein
LLQDKGWKLACAQSYPELVDAYAPGLPWAANVGSIKFSADNNTVYVEAVVKSASLG